MLNSNYVGIAYSTEKNIQIERKKIGFVQIHNILK